MPYRSCFVKLSAGMGVGGMETGWRSFAGERLMACGRAFAGKTTLVQGLMRKRVRKKILE
jgi:hypothetical protein